MSLLAFVTEFPSPAQRAEKLLALAEKAESGAVQES